MIHLLFAVHNHQPVGNFDFIFERAFDRAYRPFLEVLKAHPRVRLSLHFSGILLDWLEAHRPAYLDDVRAMCGTGQVEVLGGGYYEPILPMLTEADRLGQVTALSRRIEALFGARPRGMWLAERVWEPSLVSSIADAGIEYVVLDGSHFKMVGKSESDLDGYFETEDQGRRLKLLPIHDVIRDYIPFRPVGEVVAALRALDRPDGGRVQVVFGDDGEKFGDWPQTFDSVYTQGWLDRFFTAMEAEPDHFAVRPLREGVDEGKSLGLVYLPPASYQEMMVWAQNPADIPRFRGVGDMLRAAGRGDDAERFVRGTFWRNFLVKYPESNRIHKQALRLSGAVTKAWPAASRKAVDHSPAERARDHHPAHQAQDHVWQAQCNCGYWHGVFGGLYLPHLRFALYRQLIAAQKLLDAKVLPRKAASWEKTDWNFDGRAEHLLNTRDLLLAFTADGAVDQLWLKRTEINLCDTLTRRREAYHAHIVSGGGGGTKLEDQIGAKEEGLESFLIYDRRLRETFAEWALPPDTAFESYRTQAFEPLFSFAFGEPEFKAVRGDKGGGAEVRFAAVAPLQVGRLEMTKTFVAAAASLEARWNLRARGGGVRMRFVAETLFCLLAGNAPDRYVIWRDRSGTERRDILASHGEMPAAPEGTAVTLADEWLGFRAKVTTLGALAPSSLWRDALETVSQSEGGYERVYQGTVIAPAWDVSLADGDAVEFGLRIDFEEGTGHGQQTA